MHFFCGPLSAEGWGDETFFLLPMFLVCFFITFSSFSSRAYHPIWEWGTAALYFVWTIVLFCPLLMWFLLLFYSVVCTIFNVCAIFHSLPPSIHQTFPYGRWIRLHSWRCVFLSSYSRPALTKTRHLFFLLSFPFLSFLFFFSIKIEKEDARVGRALVERGIEVEGAEEEE